MNIHEHQAKKLLKEFGAPVPNGVYGFSVDEILQKSKLLKTNKYVLKAQIHQILIKNFTYHVWLIGKVQKLHLFQVYKEEWI